MPKIEYKTYRPQKEALHLITISNQILKDYAEQGYSLTLRQLYYQLVARDYIPNSVDSYNKLGQIISRARDGGLIDWTAIEDRARNVQGNHYWERGEDFIQDMAHSYRLDLWQGQNTRCFVLVEKEALVQVISRAARKWDVHYLACKGYLSSSIAWEIGHDRMLQSEYDTFKIIHLGDHDPSGIDMTRDIIERVQLYSSPYDGKRRPKIEIERIALNMDQVEEYAPPANPAKQTDSRFFQYQELHGDSSWELDALEPSVIEELIENSIVAAIDDYTGFIKRREKQHQTIEKLKQIKL